MDRNDKSLEFKGVIETYLFKREVNRKERRVEKEFRT